MTMDIYAKVKYNKPEELWKATSASLAIPDGVTTICDSAFKDNEKIRNINFPKTLTDIGDSAFSGCSELTEVEFPKGLQRIGRAGFKSCSKGVCLQHSIFLSERKITKMSECSGLGTISMPIIRANLWQEWVSH